METSMRYVGLDYHQSSVQICVLDPQGKVLLNRACANDWQSVGQCVTAQGTCVHAAIEACCGAANLAEQLVTRAGWSVELAHPGYVARIKQSPDKTDFSDARLLADLKRVGYLPGVWLAPEPVRELRQLVRYRHSLTGERRSIKQRIRALLREQRRYPPAGLRPWTKDWMAWLEAGAGLSEQGQWIVKQQLARLSHSRAEIDAVERRLAKLTRTDPIVQRLMKLMAVGLITACVLRAEIGRFDRFHSGKQLARFCGLSPANRSSGTRQADAGLIDACNPLLRATIIEAAHRLVRHDPQCQGLAKRLREAGKPAGVMIAAVANRWMRRLWHEMKSVLPAEG